MNKREKTKKRIEWLDVVTFFMICTIWGIVLLSFFPGLLSADSVDQILQAQHNAYTTGHPVIHTFLTGNLSKIGLWVPPAVQIIIFAFVWIYACRTVRRYNPSKKNKILQLIFTFVICIIPINFMYSITCWKDVVYTYAIILLLVLTYIGIKEKYKYSTKEIFLIALSSVIIMDFRYNGIPIAIFMFFVLLVCNIKNNKKIKDVAKFIGFFVIVYLVFCSPKWFVNISTPEQQTSRILTSTQLYGMGALLNSDVEMEQEEIEFLNSIFPVDEWKECYHYYNGFAILYNEKLRLVTSDEEINKLNDIFFKYAAEKPDVVFQHFSELNSIWWSVRERGGVFSFILNNDGQSNVENGRFNTTPILKNGNAFFLKYIDYTQTHNKLYYTMYRPAFSIWVSLACLVYIISRNWKKKNEKRGSYILMLFPMAINIAVLALLIISQDLRYYYPCHVTAYVLILICLGMMTKKNECKSENDVKMNKENPKVLVIVPAYNESKTIKKVVEDITNISHFDYVVVNDCSKDNTKEICKENKFNTLSLPVNYGLTSGIQIGMKYAYMNDYDIAIQFDGDGQHDAKYLKQMVELMKSNDCDIVIGSRFVNRKKKHSLRMLGNTLISLCIRITTGAKIKDTTSGMRAYNKKAIYEFVNNPTLTPEPDTIAYMIKNGYKIKETPVMMKDREFGESYLKAGKAIEYMLSMIFSIIFIRK